MDRRELKDFQGGLEDFEEADIDLGSERKDTWPACYLDLSMKFNRAVGDDHRNRAGDLLEQIEAAAALEFGS